MTLGRPVASILKDPDSSNPLPEGKNYLAPKGDGHYLQ